MVQWNTQTRNLLFSCQDWDVVDNPRLRNVVLLIHLTQVARALIEPFGPLIRNLRIEVWQEVAGKLNSNCHTVLAYGTTFCNNELGGDRHFQKIFTQFQHLQIQRAYNKRTKLRQEKDYGYQKICLYFCRVPIGETTTGKPTTKMTVTLAKPMRLFCVSLFFNPRATSFKILLKVSKKRPNPTTTTLSLTAKRLV